MRVVCCLVIISGLAFWGCSPDPSEILIASKPSGAVVLMDDVEVGITPMELKISKDSRIQVKKPGYFPHNEVLSQGGDPNLLIKLEQVPQDGIGIISENDLTTDSDLLLEGQAIKPPVAAPKPPVNSKPRASAKKKPRKPKRLTISEVKQNYRSGAISKSTYKQQVYRLKSDMDQALRHLKERYRRGDFDKIEYQRRVRQTKYRYSG